MNVKLRVLLFSAIEAIIVAMFYGANSPNADMSVPAKVWVYVLLALYVCVMIFFIAFLRASYELLKKRNDLHPDPGTSREEHRRDVIGKIRKAMSQSPYEWWYLLVGVAKGLATAVVIAISGWAFVAVAWIVGIQLVMWEYYFRAHAVLHEIDAEERSSAQN